MTDQEPCDCRNWVATDTFSIAHLVCGGHLPSCPHRPRTLTSMELIESLLSRLSVAESQATFYHDACVKGEDEVQQILGKALGYPDLYPEASSEDDGTVGVGDPVAASLAMEAADRIGKLDLLVRRHYGPMSFGAGMYQTRDRRGFDELHDKLDEAERAAWKAAFPDDEGKDD